MKTSRSLLRLVVCLLLALIPTYYGQLLATITHIQTQQGAGTGSTTTAQLTNVAEGNLIVVTYVYYPYTATITVTDNAAGGSNTYTRRTDIVATNNDSLCVSQWWCIIPTGKGGNLTITATVDGAYPTIFASEFNAGSGKIWSSPPTDVAVTLESQSRDTSANACTSGASPTRTQAEELLIGSLGDASSVDTTIVAGTNIAWTIPTNGKVTSATYNPGATEYFVAAAAGTDAATFTHGQTSGVSVAVGTYKNEASGGGTVVTHFLMLLGIGKTR